jgi:hypothetical protein
VLLNAQREDLHVKRLSLFQHLEKFVHFLRNLKQDHLLDFLLELGQQLCDLV